MNPNGSSDAWGTPAGNTSRVSKRQASASGVILQPLPVQASSTTAHSQSNTFNSSRSDNGPILPYLQAPPQPAVHSARSKNATAGAGKKHAPLIAALAHTPKESSTYQSISQLYQVYNIGGLMTPQTNAQKKAGKGKKRQPQQSTQQHPSDFDDTSALGGADSTSQPYIPSSSDSQLPPGSFPYGPLHSGTQTFIQQPSQSMNSTLQEGTYLPIPSNEEAVAQALRQQQQQHLYPAEHYPHQYPMQPQPPSSKPSQNTRFSRNASKKSIADAEEKEAAAAAAGGRKQKKITFSTASSGKANVVDDSNEVVVVYDRSHDPNVMGGSTLDLDEKALPDETSSKKHHAQPSYQVAPAPGYTAELSHLMATSAGEDLSGSGGSAALELTAGEEATTPKHDHLFNNSKDGLDAASNWRDELYAFLSNEEHQRRLLRWNLQEGLRAARLARRKQRESERARRQQARQVATAKTGANLLGGDEEIQVQQEEEELRAAALEDATYNDDDDESSAELLDGGLILYKSDMEVFASTKLDSIVYFQSFEADGRSFSSLLELARATEFAHAEWIKRKAQAYASSKGNTEFDDASLSRVLAVLKAPHIHLFDLASNVNVTKKDLIALLHETSMPLPQSALLSQSEKNSFATERSVELIQMFNHQGRRFWNFDTFLHAIIVEEIKQKDQTKLRQEILTYLNSEKCTLFQKPTHTYTGQQTTTTQQHSAPTYEVTENDVDTLCSNSANHPALSSLDFFDHGSASIGIPEILCPYLIQLLEQRNKFCGHSFKEFFRCMHEEKRRLALALASLVHRSDASEFGSGAGGSPSNSNNNLPRSTWGEMPSNTLLDEDLVRLFVESGVGMDITRYFALLETEKTAAAAASNNNENRPQNQPFHPLRSPPPYPTVTDLITRLRAMHSHWVSRRRAVLDYLSSNRCQLFSQSTKDILVGISDVDRLLTEGGAEPHTVRYLEVYDQAHRTFNSVNSLIEAVKQTRAIVHDRQTAAKQLLRDALSKPNSVLLTPINPANPPPEAQFDRLLEAGGSTGAGVMHHLNLFEVRGQKFASIEELSAAIGEAQTRAVECKRAIWSHLHSGASRLLLPLARERKAAIQAAKDAAIAAQRQKEKEEYLRGGRNKKNMKASLSAVPTALAVAQADPATVAVEAADSILSEEDVSVSNSNSNAATAVVQGEKNSFDSGPLLALAPNSSPQDASSGGGGGGTNIDPALRPSNALPTPILSTQEVDALYKEGLAGEETLPILWNFESEGLSFSTLSVLIEAVQNAGYHARQLRAVSRRCILHFLSSGACQLFSRPVELRRSHLDQLLTAAGNNLQFTLFHLLRLNRRVALELVRVETFAELVREVLRAHTDSIQQREEIKRFLSSPDCTIWAKTGASNSSPTTAAPEIDNDVIQTTTSSSDSGSHAEYFRPQVTDAQVNRLFVEGLAGSDTMVWLRKLQVESKKQNAVTGAEAKPSSSPFTPFTNMLSLINHIRTLHARLLGQQMRLLRFFNAPAGAPALVIAPRTEGEESDANLWSGAGEESKGFSVYDLVDSRGRDLNPLSVRDITQLAADCHLIEGYDKLLAMLVDMAQEHAEKLSQANTSKPSASDPNPPLHRPYQSVDELLKAVVAYAAAREAQAQEAKRKIIQPILTFLNTKYKGFIPPAQAPPAAGQVAKEDPKDKAKRIYDEEDVRNLMEASGAKNETLLMLHEVALTQPYTPTKADVIEVVKSAHVKLQDMRQLIQSHLTSPYCELFLEASHSRIPLTWVFPQDIDRLLVETFADSTAAAKAARTTLFNWSALSSIQLLEVRGTSIGSWNALIHSLKSIDSDRVEQFQWEQSILADCIALHRERLFSSAQFALTSTHLNRILTICDGSGAFASFLLRHCFIARRREHKSFAAFGDLLEALTAKAERALQHERECSALLNNPSTRLLPSAALTAVAEGSASPTASGDRPSLMTKEGFILIAPSSIAAGTGQGRGVNYFDPNLPSSTHDVLTSITMSSVRRLCVEGGAGTETLYILQNFAKNKRFFATFYDLVSAIRASVDEHSVSEQALYDFFHPQNPNGVDACHLFDYAPEPVDVTHAECTRILLQSEAGPKTLQFVTEQNAKANKFDTFDNLIDAVSAMNQQDIAQQKEYNNLLRKQRERLAHHLASPSLHLFKEMEPHGKLDLKVGEPSSDAVLDAMISAAGGITFDKAQWESLALVGNNDKVLQALDQIGSDDNGDSGNTGGLGISGNAAVTKAIQLLNQLNESGWRFRSPAEIVPLLRVEAEKNARTVRIVRKWLQSSECRLFVEIEPANDQSSQSKAGASKSSEQPAAPAERQIVTLAHGLSLPEVDTSLLEKGGYYEPNNAPENAIDDLVLLQGNLIRNSKSVVATAAGGENGTSAASTAAGGTFRSLDSLARALHIVHAEKETQAELEAQQVLEFITSPKHGLLASVVAAAAPVDPLDLNRSSNPVADVEITRGQLRQIVTTSPVGKPLCHLQYLASSRSCFADMPALLSAVEQSQRERERIKLAVHETLTLPTGKNLIFKKFPPTDLPSASHLSYDLVEKLMTDTLTDRKTLHYIRLMLRRAEEAAVVAHDKAQSSSGTPKKDSSRLNFNGLSLQTFQSLSLSLSRFHLEYSAKMEGERIRILAWLCGSTCRLFERGGAGVQGIRFHEEDMEGFFVPLPGAPEGCVPPEVAALNLLKQQDEQGVRFGSLKECIEATQRLHGKNLAIRREIMQFFDPTRTPNASIFAHSLLGVIHVGEREVERLWTETEAGPLALRYIYSLECAGRRMANVDELVSEVRELHAQGLAREEGERQALLEYLNSFTLQAETASGLRFDAASASRLLVASQASAAVTRTYLEYLDDAGEGVIPAPPTLTKERANADSSSQVNQLESAAPIDVVARLEARLRVLSREAHAQKHQLFAFLTDVEKPCEFFTHALHSEDVAPSFAKLDELWSRGGAGLQTLPILRQFSTDKARFESFEALGDAVRRERLRIRETKEEMASWLSSNNSVLFGHILPKPKFHPAHMQALLAPSNPLSGLVLAGGGTGAAALRAAQLDALSLLKSLNRNPKNKSRFNSLEELTTVLLSLQQRRARAFKALHAFLTDVTQCHIFSERSYGVPIGAQDLLELLAVAQEHNEEDETVLCHLWALEAAGRKCSGIKHLIQILRSAFTIERSYPVLDEKGEEFSGEFPRVSLDLFGTLFGLAPRQNPFPATDYNVGVLATQLGVKGVKLDEREADYNKKETATQSQSSTTADTVSQLAPAQLAVDSSSSTPVKGSSTPVPETKASNPAAEAAKAKQAIFEFLWAPSCSLLLPGADLVTSSTVDALYLVQSGPTGSQHTALEYLEAMQQEGVAFHTTVELVEEVQKRHAKFLQKIEENLMLASGAAAMEAPVTDVAASQDDLAASASTTSSFDQVVELPEQYRSKSSTSSPAMGAFNSTRDTSDAAAASDESVAASAVVPDNASSTPLDMASEPLHRKEEEVATAKALIAQRQETFTWLGSGHCLLLPLATAITEAEVGRIFQEGGAGLKTRQCLNELEEAGENFTRMDDLIAAVRATNLASISSRQTLMAILTNAKCCLIPDPVGAAAAAAVATGGMVARVTHADVSSLITKSGATNDSVVRHIKRLQEEHLASQATAKPMNKAAAFKDLDELAAAIKRLDTAEATIRDSVILFAHSKKCMLFKGVSSIALGKIRPSDALRLMYESGAQEQTAMLLQAINEDLLAEASSAEKSASASTAAGVAASVLKKYRYLDEVILALEAKLAQVRHMRLLEHASVVSDYLVTAGCFSYNSLSSERIGLVGQKTLTNEEKAMKNARVAEAALAAEAAAAANGTSSSSTVIIDSKPEFGHRYTIEQVAPLLAATAITPYQHPELLCDAAKARYKSNPLSTLLVSSESTILALQQLESEGLNVGEIQQLHFSLDRYALENSSKLAEIWSMLVSYSSSLFGTVKASLLPILASDVNMLIHAGAGSAYEVKSNLPLLASVKPRPPFTEWSSLAAALSAQRIEAVKRRARATILAHLSDPSCRLFAGNLVQTFTDEDVDRLSAVASGPLVLKTASIIDAVVSTQPVQVGETGSVTRLFLSYLQSQGQSFEAIQDLIAQIKVVRELLVQH